VAEPGAQWLLADGHNLPLRDDAADFVTNLGSLEHFTDLNHGIREIARVLKPTGRAAVLLPNSYYLGDILWYTLRKGQTGSHKQPIDRFAAYRDWYTIIEQNGLHIEKSMGYNFAFPTRWVDVAWYRRFPRKIFHLALGLVTPLYLSYCFLFICRKARGS
jgi:SAM-dependent methyltransferase